MTMCRFTYWQGQVSMTSVLKAAIEKHRQQHSFSIIYMYVHVYICMVYQTHLRIIWKIQQNKYYFKVIGFMCDIVFFPTYFYVTPNFKKYIFINLMRKTKKLFSFLRGSKEAKTHISNRKLRRVRGLILW